MDTLIQQPKSIREMPRLRERNGFARYIANVLVEDEREIDLIMEAHVGLTSALVSPNAVLRWMNIRIRGLDEALEHANIPGLQPVQGWHEHVWNDAHYDAEIRGIPPPPLGLRAFFKNAARLWNIRIVSDTEPTFDEQ